MTETAKEALARLLAASSWTKNTLAEVSGYNRRTVHKWLDKSSPSVPPAHVLDAMGFVVDVMTMAKQRFAKPQSQSKQAPPPPVKLAGSGIENVVADLRLLRPSPPPSAYSGLTPLMQRGIENENRRLAAERARSAGLAAPPTIREASREAQPSPPPPIPQTTDPFMLGAIEKEKARLAAEKARLAALPAPPTIPLKPKES
jgi:hypothetical protein